MKKVHEIKYLIFGADLDVFLSILNISKAIFSLNLMDYRVNSVNESSFLWNKYPKIDLFWAKIISQPTLSKS